MTDAMTTLQNRWYHGLTGSLPGLDPGSFQISQPCPPIPPTDAGLWAYADVVPPASLTFNRLFSAESFFAAYAAVVGQLAGPENELEKTIGEEDLRKWEGYLATLDPQPPPSQLPVKFRDWAMLVAPTVMSQGASALARGALAAAARGAVTPYLGPHARPVDFETGYGDVVQLVRSSMGASLSIDGTTSADVEATWTGGDPSGVQGLWTGCDRDDALTLLFADSEVRVEAGFQHFWLGVVPPGAWYQSALLHTAYGCPGTPVWVQDAEPDWDDAFGEEGFLTRFLASLVLVDGVDATITSDAVYDQADRETILGHARDGLWPFYAPSGAGVTNRVTFGRSGMKIEIRTEPGNPLVLGGVVLGTARYLGG